MKLKILDLGYAPPSNSYLQINDLFKPEQTYPLRIYLCDRCFLVQTEDYSKCEDLFSKDYAYFSSVSSTLLEHARKYSYMIIPELGLDSNSLVLEVACNDGYLLRNFVEKEIPCIGIEPADSTALAAEAQGIPVIHEFFGKESALKFINNHKAADLVIGNNVFAHVPDINDFTAGLKTVLSRKGTITLEFQHLLNLIMFNEFDTIYHEHYSYLTLNVVRKIFKSHRLKIYNAEKIDTHGGSLRVYGCHSDDKRKISGKVMDILGEEDDAGMNSVSLYLELQPRANKVKNDLLRFLLEKQISGKRVAAYGAAAKANTLFNYASVRPDLVTFICDAARSKQGKFLPGSHIPVLPVSELQKLKPDYIIIIPWNIKDEIIGQLEKIIDWDATFVIAIPELRVFTTSRPNETGPKQ